MRRRAALAGIAAGLAGAAASSRTFARSRAADEVVLYSSVDAEYLTPIAEAYQKSSGVRVKVVGDTEATKTTGLTQRLIAERGQPRCDVWWSSEALGTAELAKAGLLEAYDSPSAKDWPAPFRDPAKLWHGLALRARVIVYNRERVTGSDVPTSIADLIAGERFQGRIGMARPRFGTTRTHMAALYTHLGEKVFRSLLADLKARHVRLFDGNAAVVRACASGEIHAGLTDTDDAYAGKRNGWPVEPQFGTPVARFEPKPGDELDHGLRVVGPLTIPNTVALVKGAPNPAAAKKLIDHILGGTAERFLAKSESRNTPVRPDVAREFPDLAIPNPWTPDPAAVLAAAAKVDALCDEILGS